MSVTQTCSAEHDIILVPGDGAEYEQYSLLNLFGVSARTLRGYTGAGLAPLHFITQRGPFQDGETVLDYRFDTRTYQVTIAETLVNRWDYWDRRDDLLDLLRPNRAFYADRILPHVYRKWLPGGKVQKVVDLVTTLGSTVVTSHDGRFVGYGLQAGDPFEITSGADAGTYTVVGVPNDYTVILSAALLATATGVHYEYRRGHGIRDLKCLLELGPVFAEGPAAQSFSPTGYLEVLRFVAHDPMWYGTEQYEEWEVSGALGDLVFDGLGAWFGATVGVGRWLFAPTFVGETVQIVYWGTADAKPSILITGPATNPQVSNDTTGASISMDYTIAAGETVTIDTLNLTVENQVGTNLLPYTSGDLATFSLAPAPQAPNRENSVYVSFSSGLAGVSSAIIYWKNRYVGI